MPYFLSFEDGWDKYYSKMDNSEKQKIWKKIQLIKELQLSRHLKHGIEFSIEEAGQYRIAFKIDEETKTKRICFIGNHKQYEKWYKK